MIQDSTTEIEQMDIPYHGMQNVIFIPNDDNVEYLKWYAEDNTALGFQFQKDEFKGVFVYIPRDTIIISKNTVSFKHSIVRNINKVPDFILKSNKFYELLSKAMNDVIAEMIEWKRETNGA